MLFSTVLYLIFFAIVYAIYWLVPASRRISALMVFSLIFYSIWGLQGEGLAGLRWTFHFLAAITFTYFMVSRMFADAKRKRLYLTITIIILVANLAIFKYAAFLVSMVSLTGVPAWLLPEVKGIFLPLAISFYTFQMTAFAVDAYRGTIASRPSAFDFYRFVLFFPQLIAGPILRSTDLLPQRPYLNAERMYAAGWRIVGGIVKKVLIADPMSDYIYPVYANPQGYTAWAILLAGMAFSIQVYFDFSGYTDLARGSALLLGFEIPENFRAPFFSLSARELWQRWHITLATWLRDYIYIPLGGSRASRWRTAVNQFVTFSLGGLWHGADYTYIAWGGMWGVLLAIERFFEQTLGIKTVPEKNIPLKIVKAIFMFVLFSIGAIMFRSQVSRVGGLTISSGKIMLQMLTGLFTNLPGQLEGIYTSSGGDLRIAQAVFGRGVMDLSEMPMLESFALAAIFMILFHIPQYRPDLLSRFKRWDPYLLLVVGAIVGGFLLPAFSQSGHQFIYTVF